MKSYGKQQAPEASLRPRRCASVKWRIWFLDSKDLKRIACEELQHSQEQLREYVAALQIRNMELEAYAHMVAHNLRDPLTILVTTSDLITHIPDQKRKDLIRDLNQIRFTAYEMNRIITSLLLFAEVSKAEAPAERVNMAWIVANVWDRLSYIIKERKAQINLPQSWPDAIGYAPWIEEVWANYISNALKHGGRPPRVELGASPQPDGMVRFWTRDNGPGLPRDTQANLFQSFDQTRHLGSPTWVGAFDCLPYCRETMARQVSRVNWARANFFSSLCRPKHLPDNLSSSCAPAVLL